MRILVAEDNHILAKILADHLTAKGHKVVQSYEGGLAARFCQQKEFDALVIDLVMPDLSGIDVLEELHRQNRMPRAIVITGFHECRDSARDTCRGLLPPTGLAQWRQPFSAAAVLRSQRRSTQRSATAPTMT